MTIAQASSGEIPPAYGLFSADDFLVTNGGWVARESCSIIPQALWFFQKESIAIPMAGHPVAGFDPYLNVLDDLQRWNAVTPPGSVREYPALVWIGSPDVMENARFDPGSERLLTGDGLTGFALVKRLDSNRSFFNADSRAFFSQRALRLRGQKEPDRFVARTFWPADFRLDPFAPLMPVAITAQALREFVRGEPQSAFSTQVIWRRRPSSARHRAGRAMIGLLLNGAQGDDDEAHAGHFALVTGRVGQQGQMHDWLVANYYTLDSESEKGIIAAMLPLENYLADLNSGQAWYRPSCMLVATLRDERTAVHLSSALARVFNQFYRHQFVYRHATANCAGISVSALRTIGWRIPAQGATSWCKAIVGLPAVSLAKASLSKGKAMFDYLTEDQTRLFPAVAFEQAGADLLQLVSGKAPRVLSPYEELLRQDVEEIMLVRIPQLPSSRAWGDYPVASVDEYQRRLPKNLAMQKIIPVAPRPFPESLKDPATPDERPLRSDYAVAAFAAGLLLLGGWLVRSLMRRGKNKHAAEPCDG